MRALLGIGCVATWCGIGCGGGATAVRPAVAAPTAQRPVELPTACLGNAVVDDGGNLVVTGRWRDRAVKVLVDTGANGGSISQELVTATALPVAGHAAYASATGTFVATTVHDAGPVELGGATISGASFIAQKAHGDRYDLAIGLDQLVGHVMIVDLARGAFCLVPSPHALADQPLRWGGEGAAREILVSAVFGDVRLDDMILDTGAGVTTVNTDLVARLAHTPLPDTVTSVDGTGVAVEQHLITVPSMCVTGACVTDHVVMPSEDLSPLVSHHVDGIVGLPFFAEHLLVVDFPAAKIAIR